MTLRMPFLSMYFLHQTSKQIDASTLHSQAACCYWLALDWKANVGPHSRSAPLLGFWFSLLEHAQKAYVSVKLRRLWALLGQKQLLD